MKNLVTVEETRTLTFYIDTNAAESNWRTKNPTTWIPESRIDQDDDKQGTQLKFCHEIVVNILWQLFGPEDGYGPNQGYIDVCTYHEPALDINPQECPYTPESVLHALHNLAQRLNEGKPMKTHGPTKIYNRGTTQYPDPYPVYADFKIPKNVTAALKRK